MKRLLITILILATLVGTTLGTLTNSIDVDSSQVNSYWWTGTPGDKDIAWLWSKEVEDILEGTTAFGFIYLDPTDTAPGTTEGTLYYHESDEALKLRTSDAWVDIDVSGASSLGSAYAIGSAITVNTDAITLTSTDAANNVILALVHGETGAYSAMTITNASSYPAIQITGSSTGDDITGTGATWTISEAGLASLDGIVVSNQDLTFEEPGTNDVYLLADTDAELTIGGTSKESINLNFATADTLTLSSDSSIDKVAWGGVDEHSGLLSIAFDVGEAGTITLAGTGANDDLTIQQTTSGQDASLILQSTGTSTSDALSLISSVGSTKIYSEDNLDIDALDNITIDTTDGTYTLTIAGGTNGKYIMTAADTASMISVDDLHIGSTTGTITIEAEEDAANAVLITADGGTASTLEIFNDTGISVTEGAYSIQLLSDLGGIELLSNANLAKAVDIMVDGGTTSSIMIFNDTGTGVIENATSIDIWSDVGGIEIQSDANLDDALVLRVDGGTTSEMTIHNDQGTAADSIEIVSDDGGITITAGDATTADILIDANDIITIVSASLAADGIYLHTNGGVVEGIKIHSDQGTSADSVELLSDVGGITITTSATTAGDILVDANDAVTIVSASLAANGVYIHANGGTAETIKIHADQGDTATSIDIVSDAGGASVTALKDFKINAALCLNDAESFGSTDATPAVTGASFYLTDASTQTLTDFDGTIDAGHIIYIESTAAVTYDVDGTPGNLKGGGTNLVTADGDLTAWIYNGTDWLLILFMDVSVDCSGGMN